MTAEVQQFATAPQAVATRGKAKYRPQDDGTWNIMHDKRVIRGNTYAALVQPQQDAAEVQKQREAQRRRLMRANQTKKRAGTPEPVPGRKHMDIQTDSYLEELTDRTVEFEAETQTDFLLDRPPSPLFMPAKIGVDIDTQIEDGELFDFDVEVEPVLEVLVGKTLEQSMMEVLEEEELESLRRHQEDFEKRRNAELLEVQRIEAAEKRRQGEVERRMQQQRARRQEELTIMRKVVSRSIASAHLNSLKERALAHLADAGIFSETAQLAVESNFVPNLFQMVAQHVQSKGRYQEMLDGVLTSTVKHSYQAHDAVLKKEKDRLQAIDDAERKAREERRLELARRERERVRIEQEQSALLEWEAYQPPQPEPQEELVEVLEIKAEEKLVVLPEGVEVPFPEDQVEALQTLLSGKQEGQKIVGKALRSEDGSAIVGMESFRYAEPEAAEGEAGAEVEAAPEGEAAEA
mmetsp:Transcript_63637/g.151817  ORF Transcript_63637/g.151817 Transcript_63637/m.151817 type:complete len:463 (-) Transcript_63637:151-1539(-)|eukprot:CAMPEP_0178440148 /NCGR_PEP_ID=MMETSP0689_2-20121128/36588_1 /TAXON_ID=160604 /ORGANISM="Amphidinium massartii, Strain CS-259" /LENGTH=462 /DNA_ID=CAMNT_0020062831 /DNA_START=55 /DNA_END=1443 /DNA_ORIENTATION=-